MNKPRKHVELIKAWADGAEIEHRLRPDWDWVTSHYPSFDDHAEYRIKPEPPPNIVLMTCVYPWREEIAMCSARPNLRLTFNPEGTKLLTAEVL